jgi:hypothetical protein
MEAIMAKTIVKPSSDVAVGDGANTGMPRPVAPDVISEPRAAKSGYGQNSYSGASSLTPMDDSNKGVSPLAANMKAASGDDVLDTIVKFGAAAMRAAEPGDDVESVRGTPATQLRKLAPGNVPDAFGMESARSRQPTYPGPAASVPASLDKAQGEPVRKPGA